MDVVDILERPQRIAAIAVVSPVVAGAQVQLVLAGKQAEGAAGRQVERGLPRFAGPAPGPGADAAAVGVDRATGCGGEGVVIAAAAVLGVEFQLPAIAQHMFERGEQRLRLALVVAPVGAGVERARRFEVAAVAVVHREAVVTRAVVVQVLILGADGQHGGIAEVPLQHAVGHLFFQRLAVDMAFAVGLRRDHPAAYVAAFRELAETSSSLR